MRKSPARTNQSNNSSRRNLYSIMNSNASSKKNIAIASRDFNASESKLNQQELKQEKLKYKKFCNKVEIMTKKGFLDYFRLEDLDGTLIADRLYACFSPTGSIDFSKFSKGIAVLTIGNLDEKLQFFFTLFDLKKNNIIEKSDMKKVLLSLLNVMLEIDIYRDDIIAIQEDVRNMSLQEREESIEIILQPYGSMITYEEFADYILSNPIIKQILE